MSPVRVDALLPRPEPGPVDPAPPRVVQELPHNRPLPRRRFDPTGRFLFPGPPGHPIQRRPVHAGSRLLISGDYAGRVMLWPLDAANPTPARTIDAHRGWVRAIAVSPDGRHFATCGNDNLVKVWSIATGKRVRELAGHAWHVYN